MVLRKYNSSDVLPSFPVPVSVLIPAPLSIDRQVMLRFRGANCAVVSQPLFSLGLPIQLGIVLPQRALNHRIFGHGFDGFVESLGQYLSA